MEQIFKFIPHMQPTLWGGNKIAGMKGIQSTENIGESWEISGVEGNETVVAEGYYKGLPLNQLVATLKGQLLGDDNYCRFGNHFPLLIKFIDAQQDLSIQVHPNDEIAHRHGKPMGKTEMWYALPSEPGAQLYNGLRQAITPEKFQEMVEAKTITQALSKYDVNEGDVFFIPAGRVHAIGAGCMVAEIQQTSDVTYRIYDFDRRDSQGRLRELHVKQAAECIDYNVLEDYRTNYHPQTNKQVTVVDCPFFTTGVVDVDGQVLLDYSHLDSFVILIGVSGEGAVCVNDQTENIAVGQTLLLPATANQVSVNGSLRLLETYIGHL